jgi:hypothetical protein
VSPVGVDFREYTYGVRFVLGEGPPLNTRVDGWNVTRIQVFATAAMDLTLEGQLVTVQAGGCIELLPGGTHRGAIGSSGDDYLLVIEFWVLSPPDGINP